jgi:hypothetical protein
MVPVARGSSGGDQPPRGAGSDGAGRARVEPLRHGRIRAPWATGRRARQEPAARAEREAER